LTRDEQTQGDNEGCQSMAERTAREHGRTPCDVVHRKV
jgi:hypothetical protein